MVVLVAFLIETVGHSLLEANISSRILLDMMIDQGKGARRNKKDSKQSECNTTTFEILLLLVLILLDWLVANHSPLFQSLYVVCVLSACQGRL